MFETVYIGLFDLAKEYTVNLNYCNKLQMRLDVADYNGGTFGIGNIKVYKWYSHKLIWLEIHEVWEDVIIQSYVLFF